MIEEHVSYIIGASVDNELCRAVMRGRGSATLSKASFVAAQAVMGAGLNYLWHHDMPGELSFIFDNASKGEKHEIEMAWEDLVSDPAPGVRETLASRAGSAPR